MTITEIAKFAGVSISTVSKLVNNKDENINPETRSRVLSIVKEYNYSPYGTMKNNSSAKTFLIGVLVQDECSFGSFLYGTVKAAQEKCYGVLVFSSNHSSGEELKHITSLCKNRVDGVLWEPISPESLQHEHLFSSANIPILFVNAPGIPNSLGINYQDLGYLCAEKLLQHGHNKFGCLIRKNDGRSEQILKWITNCLFQHQLTPGNAFPFYKGDTLPTFTSENLTAVIGGYYEDTLSLYEELQRLHLHIPSDISLITLQTDNIPSCRYPHISGYIIPCQDFGHQVCLDLISICEKSERTVTSPSFDHYELNHEESIGKPYYLKNRKFVVIGSINNDVCMTVDSLPKTGKSTIITNSFSYAGGKGVNQAVGLSLMGHEAVLIGKVGNDPESSLIYDSLNQMQVSTEKIHKDNDSQTGKAYVYISGDGNISITYIPGANTKLCADDILAFQSIFKNCEYCLISTDIPIDAAEKAMVLGKKYSAKTILKPSTINALPEIFFRTTDIFIPNKEEAAVFCPQFDTVEKQAEYFFDRGMPVVIITLGPEGCYAKTENMCRYFPAPDFPVIDSTGGADAFISALAAHLSDGYTLETAIQISQYAAGFCISRQGVISALVDKDTLHSYITQAEPAFPDI